MKGLSSEELTQLILSVGTHGSERPLSPTEVSELITRSIDAGSTRAQCAERLRIGTTQVASFLRLRDVVPELRDLASWGSQPGGVAFSSLALVAQLDRPSDQRQAAQAILEHDLSWTETVQLIQICKRSGADVEEAVRRVVALRPEIETRHVVVGSITDDVVREKLSGVSQHERDGLLQQVLATGKLPLGLAGRLGSKTFTLVSSNALNADAVEAELNQQLESLLQSDA